MKKPILVPFPKNIEYKIDAFNFKNGDCLLLNKNDKDTICNSVKRLQSIIQEQLKMKLPLIVKNKGMYRAAVLFQQDDSLSEEEYRLDIFSDFISIRYRSGAGAFHAISTLNQLIIQYGKKLPCMSINDAPDFKARGIMLDVSRDKIPTMETLYRLVDFMADLKMNQLQLYIEGFSFAYSTYPFVWQDGTPITGEEIMELDRYCKQRYVELVPNQNSFGHMGAWLSRREFRDMAECPECPATLDPSDRRSIELVKNITSDLQPYFSSELFNVCCDETFDLGEGKSKEIFEKSGGGRLYLDFLMKVYNIVKSHDKRMMFWGDIIMKYPELISELPKDVIALEWGYEANHPFSADGEKFSKAGIDFYVCPGTSTWRSIAGRTENMIANLMNSAVNGKKHGAIGFLITDWGDCGHWQYQPFSYPGFAYAAAFSWCLDQNRDVDIPEFLSRFIFKDIYGKMGKLVMDLGNYYLKEKNPEGNGTGIAKILYASFENTSDIDGLDIDYFEEVMNYAALLQAELDSAEMQCEDAELIDSEFRNAVRFIIHGCNLGILKLYMKSKADSSVIKSLLERMIEEITILIRCHENLWLTRNRHGGLNDSISHLINLKEQYQDALNAKLQK